MGEGANSIFENEHVSYVLLGLFTKNYLEKTHMAMKKYQGNVYMHTTGDSVIEEIEGQEIKSCTDRYLY